MLLGVNEDENDAVSLLVGQYDKFFKSVELGEELIKEMIMSSIFGIPITSHYAKSLNRVLLKRITNLATNFRAFNNLSTKVQEVLLKRNADLIVCLRLSIFFEMKTGLCQIRSIIGHEDIENTENMIAATLKSNSTTKASYKPIQYYNIHNINMTEKEISRSQRHLWLQRKIAKAVAFNECLAKVLSYVLLFCSDFSDDDMTSSARIEVEISQQNLIRILQKFVSATFPESVANYLFREIMECVGNLRELVL